MLLGAYKVNGIAINELDPNVGRFDNIEPFQVSDILSAQYADISGIENWNKYGGLTGKDYKVIRQEIKSLVENIGWNNLSFAEKTIAADFFTVDKNLRDEIYTTEQQIILGAAFHLHSIEARSKRIFIVTMEAYNRLTKDEQQDLLGDMKNSSLVYDYINYGQEGTIEGDSSGLFDYIDTRAGTIYENIGLRTKAYNPIGMTIDQFADRMMDILKNGNY